MGGSWPPPGGSQKPLTLVVGKRLTRERENKFQELGNISVNLVSVWNLLPKIFLLTLCILFSLLVRPREGLGQSAAVAGSSKRAVGVLASSLTPP